MSEAGASGGGMKGSGDDNGGDKKRKGKAMEENPSSPPSSTEKLFSPLSSSDDEEAVDGGKTDRRSTLDLAALESSLPMKRGLSSHYDGRSKTFGNLSELGLQSTEDLGKKEHAINKRRRLDIAHELYAEKSGNSSKSTTLSHASSLPTLFTSHARRPEEDEKDDDEDEDEDKDEDEDEDKDEDEDEDEDDINQQHGKRSKK